MSLLLRRRGSEILTFPSAFTVKTGSSHWETLLRARAIETQTYVIGAAQTGKHNAKRESYGHAMIVDPWGMVYSTHYAGLAAQTSKALSPVGMIIAQCQDREPSLAYAEIDMGFLERVRREMPVEDHRRDDLYVLDDKSAT
ncbi:Nitrilase [Borealophlyctis nickersoniae]|nr:Nitrilase [Borealophlyctis nickersoniae]